MGDDSVPSARSSVLRLRGLPFQATEADIEQFFEGYSLTRCVICKRNGRATGEAYVQLESEALAAQAMHERNCKYVGRRYIESVTAYPDAPQKSLSRIFEALESDLATSLATEVKGVLGFVLRLRGLPYSATRLDVEAFFDGLEICKGEEGVVFSVTSLGKPTGEAYVEFVNEEHQLEAMKKHKEHMGSRYIELFKSTKADLLQALQQNRFYKEQAEKRQMMSQTVIGLPSSMDNAQRLRMPGYNFGVDEVTDVLKGGSLGGGEGEMSMGVGLNVRERSSLMLSPTAPPFQSATAYDRLQSFRAPTQQYVSPQSGYISPQYYIPDQSLNRPGISGRLYSRGGQMYDVQSQQRASQQGMLHPEVMMRHQGPYMMRPPLMQQPHQMMMRYPTQAGWIPERQPSPLSPINTPVTPSFTPPPYTEPLHSGLVAASPSGPTQMPYSTTFVPNRTLPEMFEGDESFEFSGKSGSSSRKTG